MNPPQTQDNNVDYADKPSLDTSRLVPVHDIRPLMRRMYPFYADTVTLDAGGIVTNQIPIASLFGEGKEAFPVIIPNRTPPVVISHMYYGKTGGVKLRFIMSGTESVAGLPAAIPLQIGFKFVPTNSYVYVNDAIIGASTIDNTSIYYNPTNASQFPVTFVDIPCEVTSTGERIYEFVIPNTSVYKYIGGPTKMGTYQSTDIDLSTEDMGNLVISIKNLSNSLPFTFNLVSYYGYTDETRLGFHSIAPVVERTTPSGDLLTSYIGTTNSPNGIPGIATNKFLYYTRL
jgi:hypothetical protein